MTTNVWIIIIILAQIITCKNDPSVDEHKMQRDTNENLRQKRYVHHNNSGDRQSDSKNNRKIYQSPIEENFCTLYIYTDPFLWRQVLHEQGGNITTAYYRIKKLIKRTVKHVNAVYSLSEFYGRGHKIYKGIKFKLMSYYIDVGDDCEPRPTQTAHNLHEMDCEEASHLPMSDLCTIPPRCKRNTENIFCNEIHSMRFYIHAFSAMNHSKYCLAYAFTYRDMDDFQGIAWIKGHNPNNSNSVTYYGYCAKNDQTCIDSKRNDSVGTIYKNYFRNTGVINLHLPISGEISDAIIANIFAHELGHSLGAKHDDRVSECNPIGDDRYLMTGNSKRIVLAENIHQLSVCSNREIGFNFDKVRCWQNTEGASKRVDERDCETENLSKCDERGGVTVTSGVLILLIGVCISILILVLTLLTFLWRRRLYRNELEHQNLCQMCKRNLKAVGEHESFDGPNGALLLSRKECQSCDEGVRKSAKCFHPFKLLRSASNANGIIRTKVIVDELEDEEVCHL